MGLFSFVTGLIGGNSAKKASRRAESEQLAYLTRAMDQQNVQRAEDRADYAPYREGGSAGFTSLLDLIGVNGPEAQERALGGIRSSPALASIIDSGTEGVLQNAAATGGVRGGNTQRSLADFRADAFAQEMERQIGRLGGVSGMGLQAVSGGSQAGQNTSNILSQILGQQGQVRAGGLLTRGGINSGMWNNAGSMLDSVVGKLLPF